MTESYRRSDDDGTNTNDETLTQSEVPPAGTSSTGSSRAAYDRRVVGELFRQRSRRRPARLRSPVRAQASRRRWRQAHHQRQ
ncbi:MAG: hypothetical protein WKF82_09110 [Nocardioidaceae bacterium]